MLGLTDVNETPVVWPRSYRRVATVSASTPEAAALQGEVLMGDVLLPPVGPALLSQGDDAFLPLLRSLSRRPS